MKTIEIKVLYDLLVEGLLDKSVLGKRYFTDSDYSLTIVERDYLIPIFNKQKFYPFIYVARALIEKLSEYTQIDEDILLQDAGKDLVEIFREFTKARSQEVNDKFIRKMFAIYMELDRNKIQKYLRTQKQITPKRYYSFEERQQPEEVQLFGIPFADGVLEIGAEELEYDADSRGKSRLPVPAKYGYQNLLGKNVSEKKSDTIIVEQTVNDNRGKHTQFARYKF